MEDFAEPASFDQNGGTPGSSKDAIFLSYRKARNSNRD
jgi:hypothetical protein